MQAFSGKKCKPLEKKPKKKNNVWSGKEKVMQTYKQSKITIRNYHCTVAAFGLFWTLAKGWIGPKSIGVALSSCMPRSVSFYAIIPGLLQSIFSCRARPIYRSANIYLAILGCQADISYRLSITDKYYLSTITLNCSVLRASTATLEY